jgi:branched-chain amino acid transport system permease protein
LLEATVNGFVLGGAYALVAVGFVLLFNNTRFFNFAHGDFLTVGAFLAYTGTMVMHLPWPLMLLGVILVSAGLGLGTELLTRRVVRRRQLLVGAIATLGLGLVIRAVLYLKYGTAPLSVDPIIDRPAVHFLGAALDYQQLIILAVALLVPAGLLYIYQRTFVGLMLKATAEDPVAAQIMGVPTSRVVRASFVGSAVLAGLAGALLAPIFAASLTLGYLIVFIAVVGSMVGGFGSLLGAVVGSVLVGIIQVNTSFFVDANYQNITVYGLLLLLFILWPAGIFGTRLAEKV